MIIGGSKKRVIENIKQAIKDGDMNRKVEEGDAVLALEDEQRLISRFYKMRESKAFRFKQAAMHKLENVQKKAYDKLIKIDTSAVGGASDGSASATLPFDGRFIITSNHFNPLDNLCIKKLIHEMYNTEPAIVIQAGNLAASGVIGDLFNYLNHIPICKSASYMRGEFVSRLGEELDKGRPVLIYPEEEMWFNYRKPRPNKRGAFYFAAELEVPVVPCFVQIVETTRPDNEEFFESEYIVHVLTPIYPDKTKTVRQNSIEMCARDYELKKQAYEKAYGKPLDYKFEEGDIVGLRV